MTFFQESEVDTIATFLREGYIIRPVESTEALGRIRAAVVAAAAGFLDEAMPADETGFLETIGERIAPATLNALRVHVIATLSAEQWFRQTYYACGRTLLESLIGNELAMQRGIGLSIQLPDDDSSLLPLHSDAWSEDSPFELVLWLPLVDVRASMSMFVLPQTKTSDWHERVHEFKNMGVEALYAALESELRWLDVPFGQLIVFTHTLLHGNRINRERRTRWSMNVRFKGLFTPYSDKRLGEFFEPITLRPASRIGLQYQLPVGFDG